MASVSRVSLFEPNHKPVSITDMATEALRQTRGMYTSNIQFFFWYLACTLVESV